LAKALQNPINSLACSKNCAHCGTSIGNSNEKLGGKCIVSALARQKPLSSTPSQYMQPTKGKGWGLRFQVQMDNGKGF
jgi:hypothetical protein